MFFIFTYVMSRVTHSEPGLPMVCWLFSCLSLTCEGRFTQCKIWWIKWKSCDKNINKRKTSPAGVEQAKEKNGSSLKLLTEHCVTFLLPSFFLISPRFFFFSVDQFPCLTDDDSSWFDLSHILLLRCDARWWQADGEKGCRLKIGTVPTKLEKNLIFWVV